MTNKKTHPNSFIFYTKRQPSPEFHKRPGIVPTHVQYISYYTFSTFRNLKVILARTLKYITIKYSLILSLVTNESSCYMIEFPPINKIIWFFFIKYKHKFNFKGYNFPFKRYTITVTIYSTVNNLVCLTK